MRSSSTMSALVGLAAVHAALAGGTVVDFENGPEGWNAAGAFIDGGDGNPLPSFHVVLNNFGIDIRNSSDPAFIGDFGAKGPVTIAVDLKVNAIAFFGQPVSREFIIELRDFDTAQGGAPWASVWSSAGFYSADPEWTTLTFDVPDPDSTELPSGWNGAGAEDPDTFEPILPPGVTYADVLSGVDEIAITTFVPGFFFGFTDFDVQVDNITITPSPTDCPDLNDDGVVDSEDLNGVLGTFGQDVDPGTGGDANGDGTVDSEDLNLVLGVFGESC